METYAIPGGPIVTRTQFTEALRTLESKRRYKLPTWEDFISPDNWTVFVDHYGKAFRASFELTFREDAGSEYHDWSSSLDRLLAADLEYGKRPLPFGSRFQEVETTVITGNFIQLRWVRVPGDSMQFSISDGPQVVNEVQIDRGGYRHIVGSLPGTLLLVERKVQMGNSFHFLVADQHKLIRDEDNLSSDQLALARAHDI